MSRPSSLTACEAREISQGRQKKAEFTSFRTFAVMAMSAPISSSIFVQLGFGTAQLLVQLQVNVRQTRQVIELGDQFAQAGILQKIFESKGADQPRLQLFAFARLGNKLMSRIDRAQNGLPIRLPR